MSDKAQPKGSDSVVVIGLGRFGANVAEALVQLGHDVLAIDSDADTVQSLSGTLPHVVQADATDAETLKQLGVGDFAHAVVSIGQNLETSVLTVLNLSQMGMKNIWAKANNPPHGRIAERLGAHHVVYPEADMGERVAHLVTGKMIDFIEFDDGFAIAKTRAPRETSEHRVVAALGAEAPLATGRRSGRTACPCRSTAWPRRRSGRWPGSAPASIRWRSSGRCAPARPWPPARQHAPAERQPRDDAVEQRHRHLPEARRAPQQARTACRPARAA